MAESCTGAPKKGRCGYGFTPEQRYRLLAEQGQCQECGCRNEQLSAHHYYVAVSQGKQYKLDRDAVSHDANMRLVCPDCHRQLDREQSARSEKQVRQAFGLLINAIQTMEKMARRAEQERKKELR